MSVLSVSSFEVAAKPFLNAALSGFLSSPKLSLPQSDIQASISMDRLPGRIDT